MRIAVTAFLASDRKTTQFTNFLLTALTGEMVAQAGGKFRVIERQQLEAALSEIEMQNVPIFEGESARDLGKFLGVDALVIRQYHTAYRHDPAECPAHQGRYGRDHCPSPRLDPAHPHH